MSPTPAVMVSSTFYDLRQIRTDLARFLTDDLGYTALLSELPSFPVNPDLNAVDNCRARVEQNADIFVLVIGGRYGSIDDRSNASITNLEFLAARQKGIPIYAFIERGVLNVLPIWKANPSADFSGAVDTSRLFEFIEYVRSQERVWTFQFDTAQDIIVVLRLQLAYLFQEALRLRLRLGGGGLPKYLEFLGPKGLAIALEKPRAWEYRLLFQSWIEENEGRRRRIKEYRSGLTLDAAELVADTVAMGWIQTHLYELSNIVKSANHLINVSAQDAFGQPGEPGTPEDIVWVSEMLGAVLDGLLRWAQRIRCARLEPPFESVAAQLALLADDLICQFETFPPDGLRNVEDALAHAVPGSPQVVTITMDFRLSNLEGFQRELDRLNPQRAE